MEMIYFSAIRVVRRKVYSYYHLKHRLELNNIEIGSFTLGAFFRFDNDGIMERNRLYSRFLANRLYFLIILLPALICIVVGTCSSRFEDLFRDHLGECNNRDGVRLDL